MFIRTVDEIEYRTQMYWNVSQCWHGQCTKPLKTSTALAVCSDAQQYLNPARPLTPLFAKLQHQIVMGGRKKTPKRLTPNNILQLKA